jgi:hypothetical protein
MNGQEKPTLMRQAMTETAKDLRSIADRPTSPPDDSIEYGTKFVTSWDCDQLPSPLNGWLIDTATFTWDEEEGWELFSIQDASFCCKDEPYYLTENQIEALFMPPSGGTLLRDLLEEAAGERWEAQR